MGVLINAVSTLEGRPSAPRSPFGPEVQADLSKPGAVENFNFGSKFCPLVSEFRQLGEGITLGDSKQTLMNAGMIAMYAGIAAGASFKGSLNSSYSATMVSAACGAGAAN